MSDHTITIASAKLPVLGAVLLAASERGLCGLAMPDWNDHELRLETWEQAGFRAGKGTAQVITQGFEELRRYATGRLTSFTVALDLRHLPPFTTRVLTALQRVPFGKLVTYGELGGHAGNPRAPRAVGQAVGRNPLAVIIPCHRVVAGNGIGGFGLGLDCKRALLAIEGLRL